MFNKDFYPTPQHVVELMINGESLEGRTVLEPSSGKGDMIEVLQQHGANVICCEKHPDLALISASKAQLIGNDFLKITADQISHVHAIYMNPPFSADEKHILHAWEIAPSGCEIVALCNYDSLKNDYSKVRVRLLSVINDYGSKLNLGDVFSDGQRKTSIDIGLVRLYKPVSGNAFGDYFTTEEDEPEANVNGLMSYNAVREVVQRYVNACKLYDEVLENAVKMSALISPIISGYGESAKLSFTCSQDLVPTNRQTFAKNLQKESWNWIFNKLNMQKYATRGLRDDINKFVEEQVKIPFTMKNIYKMLDLVVNTQSQRMDKALLEVFDRLTMHYHDNRYGVEGWKTNSHYLINQKFIIDNVCYQDQRWYKGQSRIEMSSHIDILEDMMKALCYITGQDYAKKPTLYAVCKYSHKAIVDGEIVCADNYKSHVDERLTELRAKGIEAEYRYEHDYSYGNWFTWTFFECKAYKKGTMHFKFRDENVWALFNQHIARIKGYPLPENVKRKAA
jgi:hypothetical protein